MAKKPGDKKSGRKGLSERQYKRIVEKMLDLVMLTKPDGKISYLSPSCSRVLGHEPGELLNKRPWITHRDDLDKAKKAFSKALKGQAGRIECRIVTKKGETRWISHSWVPVKKGTKLLYVQSLVKDITERKKAEETLNKRSDEFGRFNKLAVNRELRMIELKKKIKELEKKLREK